MPKKKPERPKYFIKETVDRPVSKREFLRHTKEEAVGDCILASDLIKRKVFTRSQVNTLIRAKILKPINYRSKIYFTRDTVPEGIKYLSDPPKLF
jgi:hypothetical protein